MSKPLYAIEFTKPAQKQFNKIKDQKIKSLINDILKNEISRDPTVGKPLRYAYKGVWSYRLGQIRLLYQPFHDRIVVVVVRIEHRKSVYRR